MSQKIIGTLLNTNLGALRRGLARRLRGRPWAAGRSQWEDRPAARRIAIGNLRVAEAREYLDLFREALDRLVDIGGGRTPAHRKIDAAPRALEEIFSLIELTGQSRYRVEVLNDPALTGLNETLRQLVCEEYNHLAEMMRRMEGDKAIGRQLTPPAISQGYHEARAVVAEMDARLNQMTRGLL